MDDTSKRKEKKYEFETYEGRICCDHCRGWELFSHRGKCRGCRRHPHRYFSGCRRCPGRHCPRRRFPGRQPPLPLSSGALPAKRGSARASSTPALLRARVGNGLAVLGRRRRSLGHTADADVMKACMGVEATQLNAWSLRPPVKEGKAAVARVFGFLAYFSLIITNRA